MPDSGSRLRQWKERALAFLRLAPPPPHAWLHQSRDDNCAQTVISMITGVPVARVAQYAGRSGALSVSEALAVLARLGIRARPVSASIVSEFWPTFRDRAGGRRLRGIAFRTTPFPGERYGHAYLLFGDRIYDPRTGDLGKLDASTFKSLDWVALLPPPK